jgi:hypothetical protein
MKAQSIQPGQTNTISFGKFAIVLEKEQLHYYADGEITRVVDVSYEFNYKDLFDLGTRISVKNALGAVKFVNKRDVVKNSK